MKFVFLAKVIEGVVCVVSIRKYEESVWYHFKRCHWFLGTHEKVVREVIGNRTFNHCKQFTIEIKELHTILQYYDALNNKFVFKECPLEKGKKINSNN